MTREEAIKAGGLYCLDCKYGSMSTGLEPCKSCCEAESVGVDRQNWVDKNDPDPRHCCASWAEWFRKNCPTTIGEKWPVRYCPACGERIKAGDTNDHD